MKNQANDQQIFSERESNSSMAKRTKNFVKCQKMKYLKRSGISFLKSMSDAEIKLLAHNLKKYPEIEMFIIENRFGKQVVLRLIDLSTELDENENLMATAEEAYRLGDFEECKPIYLQLLRMPKVDAIIYERLGIIRSQEGVKSKCVAIKYLSIANYLNKEAGLFDEDHDFSDLISELILETSYIVEGQNNYQSARAYNPRQNNVCTIKNLAKITDYILVSGLDIDTACEQLEMTAEQIDVVKLMYAREYYTQGDLSYGDVLMKAFEHSPNKTPYTISLFDEIRKHRNLYTNRRRENTPRLELGLKSRKNSQQK